ncbi:UNVERIFIED_CONTAM: hypothetical protein GTU68_002864 [Idotea baltica]|nr:hypothetical protein [Idotea baltica]
MLNQKACCLWLTGLSGSGKTTIAQGLEKKMYTEGYLTQVLDGDNIRSGINNNLGFTIEDREENIRRIAEVTKLYINSGIITINCFVSPTNAIREKATNIIGEHDMLEVFVNTPLEVCEARDVKGLYKKARAGEIKNFTGIDSPFEAPENPAFELKTDNQTVEESVQTLFNYVISKIKFNN